MALLSSLKQARMVRVLLVYLGASWVVVEAADLLQEALGLPDWLVPVVLVLLLVGLVVVLATAWVQGHPATDRAEAAGEVPTDWQVDLPDLARSLRRGRLPHLTWGRALAGMVVAFLALFGLVALLVPGVGAPQLGPRTLSADEAAPGLAVLPFRVTGEGVGTWREGLVDLLSRNLDGLATLRAIDSRTVLARWRETVDGDADLATALEAARRAGARWALLGNVVEAGPTVRVTADLHDVESGARIDGVLVEGARDSMLTIVDALSVDVARLFLERESPDLSSLRLASITTASPEALYAFLEGEAAYRRSRFEESLEGYERAVEIDSTFALAHFRIGSARGWAVRPGAASARAQAYAHRDRLPDREALLVEAEYRARRGALPSGVALLRQGVRRYPDDPELWYNLGDIYLHYPDQLDVLPRDGAEALRRAVELDPGFAPYYIHLVDLALIRGDSAEARRLLETERELAGRETIQVRSRQIQFDYLYGSPAQRARALAAVDTADADILGRIWAVWSLDGDKADEALRLSIAACDRLLEDTATRSPVMVYNCLLSMIRAGALDQAVALNRTMLAEGWDGPVTVGHPVVFASLVLRQTGMAPSAPASDSISIPTDPPRLGSVVPPDLLLSGMLALERGRTDLADSVARMLESDANAMDARGDTLDARIAQGLVHTFDGYLALADNRTDDAIRLLGRAADLLAGSTGPEQAFRSFAVWPLAETLARTGRHREAIRYYRSLWSTMYGPPALLRRADQHDQLGEPDQARALRRQFLQLWTEADPDHPLVAEARAGLPAG